MPWAMNLWVSAAIAAALAASSQARRISASGDRSWLVEACVKRRLIASNPPVEMISATISAIKLLVFIQNTSYLMVHSVAARRVVSKRDV
jgi:hypothetical protein